MIYVGHEDIENALQHPAISQLQTLIGSDSGIVVEAVYETQSDMHIAQADGGNYLPQTFTSYLPAASELGAFVDVVVDSYVDGSLPLSAIGLINGMMGGQTKKHRNNAVGGVLRSCFFEVGLAGTPTIPDPSNNWDAYELSALEAIQAAADNIDPVVQGKYINEWVSHGGLVYPRPGNFWDADVYARLLNVKQKVDPCNILTIEAGVGYDLPHCGAQSYHPVVTV